MVSLHEEVWKIEGTKRRRGPTLPKGLLKGTSHW